ncbi:MAG: Demethylmenaquinone methyltransferase [Candidatus Izimaplasma bacterium HR2]|nr:MAG: Demethylmenaquinone methyltransferase [Candidatus Izimaplasma bacterium HR2]
MRKLRRLMKSFEDTRILDIGTGNGNFIRILTSLDDGFKSVVGIDLLSGAIKVCKSGFNDERIKFMKMDALKMDFEDNSFDIISLSNSLHHLDDISATLKEMERVLAPGGVLLFCEMRSNNLTKKQKSHLKMHHYAAEIDRERGSVHYETFTDKEILNHLTEKSSLDIKDVWEFVVTDKEEITPKEIEWLFETIDRVQERVEGSEKREYFRKKADKIKNYIRKYGFDSATQLIVVIGK